ncbi:hypothetical protein OIU79_012600 [Salix purpurea]|uniref:Uncharacterized protein n=1 Tax=Salix purpurea TaxID=77065 RepID=A0A9Q0T3P3_SALPP|nr:hypothetical protein OIU79_012600 [Salix purpurea]
MSPVLLDFRENAALTFLTRLTPLPTAILCSEADGSKVFGVLSKYATVLYGNKWLPLSGSLLFSSRGLLCCVGMHEADL